MLPRTGLADNRAGRGVENGYGGGGRELGGVEEAPRKAAEITNVISFRKYCLPARNIVGGNHLIPSGI
jgi:hypothetical protein